MNLSDERIRKIAMDTALIASPFLKAKASSPTLATLCNPEDVAADIEARLRSVRQASGRVDYSSCGGVILLLHEGEELEVCLSLDRYYVGDDYDPALDEEAGVD